MGIWSTIKAEEKKKKEREEKENKERADKKESGKKGSEKTSSQKSYPTAKKAADELGDRFKTTGSPLQRKVVTSKDYKDTKNKPTLADNDRRALLRERETYKIENNKGVSGLLNGLTLGLTDIDRNNTMSVLGGTKEDYDRIKEAKSSTAYKAGDTVGSIVTSLIPYSGAAKAVGASSKVARAGSKVGKLVSKVPGVTEKTAEKVGKGIASSVATDVIAGTPLDVLYSAQQATNYDENGKQFDKGVFGKQLALNTAINIGAGAAMEAAAPAVKRLLNKVPEGQPVLQNNGTTKNVSPKKLEESYANQQRTVDAGVNDTSRMTVDTKVNNVASDTVNTPSAIKDAPEVTARQEADLQTGITPNTETVKATIPPEAPASKNTLGKRTVKSPKLRTQDTITIEDIDFGKSEVMDRFYAKVQDTADYIRNYKPKGAENSLVPSSYGEDFRKLKATTSNNDRWYSEFYKQNGRRPNKSEAEELALKLVEDTVKYGNVNEFYDPDFIGFLKQNRVNKQSFSTQDTIVSDKTANSIPGKLQQNKDGVKPQTKDLGADVNKYGYQRKTSKVRSNTYENSPMFDTVKTSLDEKEFQYDVVTEKESVDRARQRLEVDFDGEVDDLANRKLTFNGEDLDTAMGIAEVYKREAEETGDFSKFIKWAKLIQKKGTEAGQFVQAFAKYTRDTAEGMVVSAQNKVRQAQEQINKKNPNLIKRVDEQASGISSDIDNAIADTVSQMTEQAGDIIEADILSGTTILPKKRTDNGKSITEQYGERARSTIVSKFANPSIGGETEALPLKELYDDITSTITGWIKSDTTSAGTKQSALEGLKRSIQNMQANIEEFANVFYAALDDARIEFAGDNAILAKIDELERVGVKGFNLSQVSGSIDEVIKELGIDLGKIVRSSGKTRNEILDKIRSTIIGRTGADESTARDLADAINARFKEIVSDKSDAILTSILQSRKPSLKSAYQKYAEMSNVNTALISRDSDVIKQALKDSGVEITELIKQDAVKKSEVKDKLIELIETKLREFDIEESLLADIKEQISDSYDSLLKEKSEQYLRNRFKDKVKSERKKTPLIEDIMDLINMGAYDNDDILDLIRKKNGIPVLDADAVSKITEYMKKSEAATTQRQKDIWRAKAEAIVADFDTSTTAEKFIAFLRINMLGNAKTLVTRNFGGNILLSAAENISEIPAAMVDKAVSLKTGKRTITGPSLDKLTAQAKGFKKGVKEWAEDVKYGVDTSPARDKYDMAPGSTFKGKNPVSKVLKSVENFIFKALQLGDRPFYQAAHDARLAELKKLGITGEEAELQAKLAGLDRTYQNNGKIAETVTKLRRALDSSGFPFGSLLIPFSQTPANIMSKMLDYSPAGLASAIVHLGKNAKNGNFDQRLFSQRVGRSLTGTGILTLGYVLAANDLLVPEIFDSDNYNLYKAEQYTGKVSYSLKVGDYYVGLSSMQPISGVLAMGAEAYAAGVNEDDLIEIASQSTKAGVNTFFNQSFMQSVFDLLSSDSPADGIKDFFMDIPTRAISSLSKQVASATDEYERETYDSNPLKELGNKFIAATPGLRQKMLPEKRDIAGNKVKTNQGRGLAMRLTENLVLPDTIKKEVKDAANDEVMALYKRTDRDGVLLQSAFKSLRVDGKDMKLTGKQYTEYQKLMGEKAYREIADVIKTKDYKELTDDEKVSLIKEINDQAKEAAENQILISAGKAKNTVWIENLSKTYTEAYQNVKNTSPKRYAEIVGKAEIDCRLAGDSDMSVRVMSMVSSNADASIYTALDGDKKSGRFYQDMVEPAKLLISKGYTAKQVSSMKSAADTDGNGYLNQDELKGYIGALDVDRETKRALYRMMYNTRSYSKSKGSRLTNNPF